MTLFCFLLREAEALRSGRNARFNNNNVDINSLPVNRISSLAENVTAGFKDEVGLDSFE